ncbi:MAG TPA: response regulator transcription factor, partial [Candidatus Solibacter sp.]|nr:response regulator transcription factor [Candidatus Solibacter sp.]
MTAAARLLVIDDDIELGRLLQEYMADEGFSVDLAANGAEGIRQALSRRFELIVLDIMLPRINGLDVLRRIRSESRAPVLMLTAKGDLHDRVLGLELGADDYLSKPFDPSELVARIRAILRRVKLAPANAVVCGDLTIDPGARTVHVQGAPVTLTTVEFDLLAVLLRASGVVVGRPELMRDVLGREFSPFDRSIDTHVYNLRRKLGRLPDGSERIRSIRSGG